MDDAAAERRTADIISRESTSEWKWTFTIQIASSHRGNPPLDRPTIRRDLVYLASLSIPAHSVRTHPLGQVIIEAVLKRLVARDPERL